MTGYELELVNKIDEIARKKLGITEDPAEVTRITPREEEDTLAYIGIREIVKELKSEGGVEDMG